MRGIIFMDRAKQSPSAFFPPSGLDCLLSDITGEYMELERPPSCGEHAHTVDEEQEVMSIRFRSVCEQAADDKDNHI